MRPDAVFGFMAHRFYFLLVSFQPLLFPPFSSYPPVRAELNLPKGGQKAAAQQADGRDERLEEY